MGNSGSRKGHPPWGARGPLNVLFTLTSMPVGGAEVLLVNLVRGMNREQFRPQVCCLKERGPLGEALAREMPVHAGFLASKFDARVLGRLTRLMRRERIDAVVTVGAGDKMFWGRLAARRAGVPVVLSAIHSTGWPDCIGRLNRLLTPWTDAFIGVAREHGRYLVEREGFPASKVVVIPNGVDTIRFTPDPAARERVRRALRIPDDAPLFGIVAALRPEKNHTLFLHAAERIARSLPVSRFLVVGDGPERPRLEHEVCRLGMAEQVLLLGSRSDIPDLLAALDVFVLTSRMEANPVSILEAMAVGLPVVATRVGSIAETVHEGTTGYLAAAGNADQIAAHCVHLVSYPDVARRMGVAARCAVTRHGSLAQMVHGYERLIEEVYRVKCGVKRGTEGTEETEGTEGDLVVAGEEGVHGSLSCFGMPR